MGLVVCVCVGGSDLECALEGTEYVYLLIDNRVFVTFNERFTKLVVSRWLILTNQRHSSFLQAMEHFIHLIYIS